MDVTHDQIAQLYRRHLSTSLRVAVPSHPPPPPPQGKTDWGRRYSYTLATSELVDVAHNAFALICH